MTTADITPARISPFERDARADLDGAELLGEPTVRDGIAFRVHRGRRNLWIAAVVDDREVAALRVGYGEELDAVSLTPTDDGAVLDFSSPTGAWRTRLTFPRADAAIVRCKTTLIPVSDLAVPYWPRDLFGFAPSGSVITGQRGLRSGIVYAATDTGSPCTLFYFQDFSSLTDYFEATNRTPADSVGGRWPELGYAPPAGADCTLPKARETVISDAYLTIRRCTPADDAQAAAMYLDLLAGTYRCLDLPPSEYHDWRARAAATVHDLAVSPSCTYLRQGRRYLMPYVGDEAKPPESMVQLTLAVNLREYDAWRERDSSLARAIIETAPSFFDDSVGSVVRWLPGEAFDSDAAESNMNHHDMDSWYLHHALFNLSRLAKEGDETATDLVRRSLPYVVRVAHRFAYRWPVFFDLRTLDVVRAEAKPDHGGENDVAGLYGLLMVQAYEIFGAEEYLNEAQHALRKLQGLGFALGYQMNTTGFAAEAAIRLWKKTGDRVYLEISEICMANLFDNMWLWQCGYGHARNYRTFFGLFPLRDAPYLAAYEELEAHAKFHEYLALAGEDVRPSLRLLIAEYQRYSLDRCWYYFADALPLTVVAEQARNGKIERALAVPLEDLQDGREHSGQVGQEVYGAGIALVMASRHTVRLEGTGCIAYCNYPMYDVRAADGVLACRIDGDRDLVCEVRVIPEDDETPAIAIKIRGKAFDARLTPEGHAAFDVRGGQAIEIQWDTSDPAATKHGVEVGGTSRTRT